jgi:hypothetical protein
MAPTVVQQHKVDTDRFNPAAPAAEFVAQLRNPGDVFSVLLLLGGDIVARAIAQLVGPRGFTPVAFSFGKKINIIINETLGPEVSHQLHQDGLHMLYRQSPTLLARIS